MAAVVILVIAGSAVGARALNSDGPIATAAPATPAAATVSMLSELPPFESIEEASGITRQSDLYTIIPTRPRLGLLKYQVQQGDTLFGIAEKFGLKPESILWGNWYALDGDPHFIAPGQELSILPVDGALHLWSEGEGLNGVADFYGVAAEDILDWPGNELDPAINPASPGIEAGTALIVPGGRRELPAWQQVRITRSNPAVASILGPGACGGISTGNIGDGLFAWPTSSITWRRG